LSPNTEKDDVALAAGLVFQPWRWKEGAVAEELEKTFEEKFGLGSCFAFNSGRSCFLAILSAINLKKGDEVIVQAFTCNAVVNPILRSGAFPVFADIGKDLNIDVVSLKEKIGPKTRAIVVQHTFGWPARIREIQEICEENNIYLIEDCAHSLGAKSNGSYCGSFGDAAFFSFGRDKVVSSVYGGIATANDLALADGIKRFREGIKYPNNLWILQQLLHPIIMEIFVLPFYSLGLGKIFLAGAINSKILSQSVTAGENRGVLPDYFPKRMPNALALLAINQLRKLERYNAHRKEIAEFYAVKLTDRGYSFPFQNAGGDEPVYMRFPLIVKDPKAVLMKMKKNNIYLNDGWCDSVIVPAKTSLEKMCYSPGACFRAEEIARNIIDLPTSIKISIGDAQKIINLL